MATRQQNEEIIRERLCANCRKNFYTREVPDLSIVLRLNRIKKKVCKPPAVLLNKEQPLKKLLKAASDIVLRKDKPNKKTSEAPAIFNVWR